MFYKQFIGRYSHDYQIPVKEATRIVESVMELLKNELVTAGRVSIRGVGSFSLKTMKKFKYRDQRTGLREEVAMRKRVSFAPAKTLKDAVNGEVQEEVQRYLKKQDIIKVELRRKGHL